MGSDASGADLTGATVTGADFKDVDVRGTVLRQLKGQDRTFGWTSRVNAGRAIGDGTN